MSTLVCELPYVNTNNDQYICQNGRWYGNGTCGKHNFF